MRLSDFSQEDGVIVATAPQAGALVPVLTRDLTQDLREIRARVRQQQQQKAEEQKAEDTAMQMWQKEFLGRAPDIFPGVPAVNVCHEAAPGCGKLDGYMRWFPPCTDLAKAGHKFSAV